MLGFGCWVLVFWFRVPGSGFRVPASGYLVSNFGFWVRERPGQNWRSFLAWRAARRTKSGVCVSRSPVSGFRVKNFGGWVSGVGLVGLGATPHKALNLIARGKLPCDERVVLHRVDCHQLVHKAAKLLGGGT